MTRLDNDLISRKALLEAIKNNGTVSMSDATKVSECVYYDDVIDIITNAPTIEADGGEAVATVKYYDITGRPVDYNDVISKPLASGTKLFTSPQKREWVELTDVQAYEIFNKHNDWELLWKAISDALKEVNHG